MSKKVILLGAIIFLILATMVYARRNDIIYMLYNFYQEECLEHETVYHNRTEFFCAGSFRYLMYCPFQHDEYGNFIGKERSFDRSEIDCNCPTVLNRTVSDFNVTDKCVAWYLVRRG